MVKEERINIVQLRSSIFIQHSNGYTPENAITFKEMLMPDAKVYPLGGIIGSGIPAINPSIPQYGLPWGLNKTMENNEEYNILFQPGKIDIILAKEAPYSSNIESAFCKQSIEWFSKVLNHINQLVTRIAYAPLYAIQIDEDFTSINYWSQFFRKTAYSGTELKDINFSFLLKRLEKFDEREIQMNFLHQLSDGTATKVTGNTTTVQNVVLFQLDLNSVPEKSLDLNTEGVASFFNNIVGIKNKLIENVNE